MAITILGTTIESFWLPVSALAIFTSYICLHQLLHHLSTRNKLPLPPQTPGKPFIGNLPAVLAATNAHTQHLLFQKWAQEHGEIFRVQVGNMTEYFINSDVAVKELFDRKAAQTAERPRWIVSNEHICNRLNVLLLPGSDARWKHQRKAVHSGLTSSTRADAGLPFLHYETAKFLYEVANNPALARSNRDLWTALGRYTYSTFSSQTFGMDIPDMHNPVIEYIHETGLAQIIGTLPGSYIVDILPWLDHLPLFLKPWERKGRARFSRDMAWCLDRLNRIKKGGVRNLMEEAFLPRVISDEKSLGFATQDEAAYLSLQLVIGAADTSQMSTWSFMEAMMSYPDVQAKAREEIEKVVGKHDRLPVFADLDRIPYVRCLMKEVWRWRPPVALGHPHTTTREIIYNGYRIPSGARLHLNAWAIQHDAGRHKSPDDFIPERWLHDTTSTLESSNSTDVRQRDHFAFGSGRRICPGILVAERSLAVSMMRLLWAFEIVPANGESVPLNPRNYPGDMPGNPGLDLPVTLRVLSEEKRAAINRGFREAEEARTPLVSSQFLCFWHDEKNKD